MTIGARVPRRGIENEWGRGRTASCVGKGTAAGTGHRDKLARELSRIRQIIDVRTGPRRRTGVGRTRLIRRGDLAKTGMVWSI